MYLNDINIAAINGLSKDQLVEILQEARSLGSEFNADRHIKWEDDTRSISQVINPFVPVSAKFKDTSYGLSSVGYDLRLGEEIMWLKNSIFKGSPDSNIISGLEPVYVDGAVKSDPNTMEKATIAADTPCRMAPSSFLLAHTYEYIKMPNNLVGFVMDKSSLARKGLSLQNTVIEPGWEGMITLEIFNMSPHYIDLYPGMGIAQLMFSYIVPPLTAYNDRIVKGKYQGQTGVQPAL